MMIWSAQQGIILFTGGAAMTNPCPEGQDKLYGGAGMTG